MRSANVADRQQVSAWGAAFVHGLTAVDWRELKVYIFEQARNAPVS